MVGRILLAAGQPRTVPKFGWTKPSLRLGEPGLMMKICVFDHGYSQGPLLDSLRDVFQDEFESRFDVRTKTEGQQEADAARDLATCNVVIAHMYDDPFRVLVDLSPAGSTRVRVSTKGLAEELCRQEGAVTYLFLRPPIATVGQGWRAIVSALFSPSASNIVQGKAPELFKYFRHGGLSDANIVALAVLCQGYLLAAEGEGISMQQSTGSAARRALVQTGLGVSSDGFVAQSSPTAAAARYNDVAQSKWWGIFATTVSVEVRKYLSDFGRDPAKEARSVLELASKIDRSEELRDPDLVANAYCEIIELLKKSA